MPLLAHFHPSVASRHRRESFHATRANSLMGYLNERLPTRYLAEVHVHLGSRVEADVVEWERDPETAVKGNGESGVAVSTAAPPSATCVLDARQRSRL